MRYVPQAFNGYYRPAQGVRLGNIGDRALQGGLEGALAGVFGIQPNQKKWMYATGGVAAGVVATLVIQRFLR